MNDLQSLYKKANAYHEQIPLELCKKIETYTIILRLIGHYVAQAKYLHGKAYADRKKEYAIRLAREEGTQKEREGKAEIHVHKFRMREVRAEADLIKWQNNYDATKEQIQAMKKTLETLKDEWKGGSS